MIAQRLPDEALSPRQIRQHLHLSRERMGRLLDVSAKTIERWETLGSLPASERLRVQLARIQEVIRLGLTVYTPDGFALFLATPMPVFGNRTAIQLMEQGSIDQVFGALAEDYEGLGF